MKAEYVNHMGDDLSVVNAARVSFAKVKDNFEDNDIGLINFLAEHDHFTPFCHTAITLRMSAPVPIRTQCFKHKVGFVENEESRRYIKSEPEIFTPEYLRPSADNVKQGSEDLPHYNSDLWLEAYKQRTNSAVGTYLAMIDDGVCPEQARLILPQGAVVNWVWTGNLKSFANFYIKRTHETAQKEVRQLALQVDSIIEPLFPHSWKALTQWKQ